MSSVGCVLNHDCAFFVRGLVNLPVGRTLLQERSEKKVGSQDEALYTPLNILVSDSGVIGLSAACQVGMYA